MSSHLPKVTEPRGRAVIAVRPRLGGTLGSFQDTVPGLGVSTEVTLAGSNPSPDLLSGCRKPTSRDCCAA